MNTETETVWRIEFAGYQSVCFVAAPTLHAAITIFNFSHDHKWEVDFIKRQAYCVTYMAEPE